jgi:hypothetical protein
VRRRAIDILYQLGWGWIFGQFMDFSRAGSGGGFWEWLDVEGGITNNELRMAVKDTACEL